MIDYTFPLDQLPDPLPIDPLTKPFDVTITPPGSKSITCRAYVLAALAEGESKIIRPLRADDTDRLLEALCTLGASARWDGEDVYIKGVAGRFPRGGNLYMGDGGTPTRFMIACACLAKEPVVIDASPRMRERPIAEGVDMLRQLGAKIEYVEAEGRLPVRVVPSEGFKGGEVRIDQTASSQFISAVLLIASFLPLGALIRHKGAVTSVSYVDLTLAVLAEWGADYEIQRRPLQFSHVRSHRVSAKILQATEYHVSRDASGAVFWAVAAAIIPAAQIDLRIDTGDSQQPDQLCLEKLQEAGLQMSGCHAECRLIGPDQIRAFEFDAANSPDGAVALSALAATCNGRSKLTGLRTLRVKETDRIAALANELRKVGCTVETGEDWISITPPAKGVDRGSLANPPAEPGANGEPVVIETYNDHRMAMAFAVLGLNPPGGRRLAIRNPKCVGKSYPGFWKDFAKLYEGKGTKARRHEGTEGA
jgi:3-phosphoshikimate 1-carboxyvinyltransferase